LASDDSRALDERGPEAKMSDSKKRGERRARTERWAKRGLKKWLSLGYKARPLGEFFKSKALSCSCTRKYGNPKVAYGCSYGGFCYNPALVERVQGNRLAKKWLHDLRGTDALDIEL
jgi:hypothetical protein